MSLDEGLEDLHRFMSIGKKTLLIKGKAGTGKVTLSLELANINRDRFKTIFVSRKLNEQDLYKRYPWIREVLEE